MSSFPVCHSVALFGILSVSGTDSKQVVEFRVVLFCCHLCDGSGRQFSCVNSLSRQLIICPPSICTSGASLTDEAEVSGSQPASYPSMGVLEVA